jgi:hypothetical protein
MNHRGIRARLFLLLAVIALFPAAARAQVQTAAAPGPGWQVLKADWGAGNRWMDVTVRLRHLLVGYGFVKVNNANMGGDPWRGADKFLRIAARDSRGRNQTLTYKEGSNLDASQFYNYSGKPYPGRPPYPPGPPPPRPGPPSGYSLQIVRAYYGLNKRTNDVTGLLRSMIRNDTLVVGVTNRNMGGDPWPGADKVLTVIYRYRGQERTSTVKEGNTLRIP